MLDLCLRKIRAGDPHDYSNLIVVEKFCFQNVCRPQRQAGVFKYVRFEERFRKAPFSWRISVDGLTNRRNKAVFSSFSSRRSVDGASVDCMMSFSNFVANQRVKKNAPALNAYVTAPLTSPPIRVTQLDIWSAELLESQHKDIKTKKSSSLRPVFSHDGRIS